MKRGSDLGEAITTGILNPNYSEKQLIINAAIVANAQAELGNLGDWEWEKRVEVPIDKIPTRGYWDGYKSGTLLEIKTGWKLWSPLDAQNHGQLTFYYLQALESDIRVDEIMLLSASTTTGEVIVHKMLPSPIQLIDMEERINTAYDWMVKQNLWDKRISSSQRL